MRIVLWGDSHAGHLKPVLGALAKDHAGAALLRYMPSCPPAIGFSPDTLTDEEVRECLSFNRDVLADIRARGTIDTVILSARWVTYVKQENDDLMLTASVKRTVAALRATGVRIVLVAPGVEFKNSVRSCLIRGNENSCGLSRAEAQRRREYAMPMIDSVARTFPEVAVVDPFDTLCTKSRCPVRRGQNPLYKDSNHLSVAGAQQLIPAFRAARQHVVQVTDLSSLPRTGGAFNSRTSIEAPSD